MYGISFFYNDFGYLKFILKYCLENEKVFVIGKVKICKIKIL